MAPVLSHCLLELELTLDMWYLIQYYISTPVIARACPLLRRAAKTKRYDVQQFNIEYVANFYNILNSKGIKNCRNWFNVIVLLLDQVYFDIS